LSRILVREPIAEAGIRLLRERGFDVDVDGDSDLAETIGAYDAIVVRSATKVTAELIDRADNLKVIGRAGVGIDNVDVEAATRRGIVVANAPESTVISAAEHTIGLLVALTRNIPQAHAALKQGRWERRASSASAGSASRSPGAPPGLACGSSRTTLSSLPTGSESSAWSASKASERSTRLRTS
jgi:phosphoglycerate dehydrogenase-like enzyme